MPVAAGPRRRLEALPEVQETGESVKLAGRWELSSMLRMFQGSRLLDEVIDTSDQRAIYEAVGGEYWGEHDAASH